MSYILALVIFGAMLAVSVFGYIASSRQADKFASRRTQHANTTTQGASSQTLP